MSGNGSDSSGGNDDVQVWNTYGGIVAVAELKRKGINKVLLHRRERVVEGLYPWRRLVSLDTTVLCEYERPEYTIRGVYYVREHNLIRTELDPVTRLGSFNFVIKPSLPSPGLNRLDGSLEVLFDFFARHVLRFVGVDSNLSRTCA